jgi:hypothetical protein
MTAVFGATPSKNISCESGDLRGLFDSEIAPTLKALLNNSAVTIPPQRRFERRARKTRLQKKLLLVSARVFSKNALREILSGSASGKGRSTRSSRMRTAAVCLL